MFDPTEPAWQAVERLVQTEQYEEARAAYEQFISQLPIRESYAYRDIIPLEIQALYDLERYAKDTTGWTGWRKGDALLTLKRYEEALAAYEQAIQLSDVRGSQGTLLLKRCYQGKGKVFSALKRFEEAFAVYEQLIFLDPKDGDGYKGKGEIFSVFKRSEEALAAYEQAFAAYEQALHLTPSNEQAFGVLEMRQKLHHLLAPGGHLSVDVLNHDLNGSRHASRRWRAPASFQGTILAGQQGRYQVAECLGHAVLTTSYRGYDLAQDRPVTVKVLYPRVLIYLATVAPRRLGLSAPQVEQMLGYGVEGTCCYLVTEPMVRPTLQAQMAVLAPFAVERAVGFAVQIAQGLEALEQAGISDEMLEPATIQLVGEQGLKLTNPGLNASWMQVRRFALISSEPMVGNVAYMAPEYAEDALGSSGKHGIRANLYSLACILFVLLCGHPPYQGETPIDIVVQQVSSPIPSICALRPDLAPAFDGFFQQALAKQPGERYQTPQAVLQALEALQETR